jgi:hypothetical protein
VEDRLKMYGMGCTYIRWVYHGELYDVPIVGEAYFCHLDQVGQAVLDHLDQVLEVVVDHLDQVREADLSLTVRMLQYLVV